MSSSTELVIVPAPGMGHLVSTVQLAKVILKKYDFISISIFIINLPMHSDKISSYVDSQSRDNPYPTRLLFTTLPPVTITSDPTSLGFFTDFIKLHKPLVKRAVEERVELGSPKPAGFVLDMFCTTMVDVANELGIPSYLFLTCGVNFLNFVYYVESLADEHGLGAREVSAKLSDPEFESVVSGFRNPITSKIIPGIFKGEFGSGMILNLAKEFKKMKGILVNSYVELESFEIQALQNSDDKKIPPIYPVGPILDLNRESGSDKEENKSIIEWLNSQPDSSIVFLCFGSMGSFDAEQVKEIANGLEKSGVRFLWALRKPPSPDQRGPPSDNGTFLEALPEGFIDRTVNRGKIIGWAPQVDVLAHPAIGGFVSHCGWNSTLESLWFGVPIGAWPMYSEQNLNALVLVEQKLAVEIRMDYVMDWLSKKGNFIVSSMEIEEGLKKLMNMDENMRRNVKDMGEKGRKALEKGGSSCHWLDSFMKDVLTNVA
uniref:Glycosyltransferase n=1 Tax=Dianthus caryophyllus TaxID=3570 RepID=A7M6I2_DIACA|nr:glucosyltransferase [Dianthus caryophyllus]